MVEIKIVKKRKNSNNFLKFVNKLYNECQMFSPAYHKKEKHLFSNKYNPNLISNETIGLLAFQEGKVVGRVLGISNRIERTKNKIVRFSKLDFINDREVSFSLLNELQSWAYTQGATQIVGSLGFNDLESIGLVEKIESDYISTLQQKFNFEYYLEHLKNYGYVVKKRLFENQLLIKEVKDLDILNKEIEKLINNNNLHLVNASKKQKIELYARKVFDLLYDNSISSYPIVIEDKVYKDYLKKVNDLYDTNDFIIITNKNDDVVGTMLLTKNTSKSLKSSNGKLLSRKVSYNVPLNFRYDIDIAMLICNKNYSSDITEILAKILLFKCIQGKYNSVFCNLWLNNENKLEIFEKYFEIKKIKSRAICVKNIENKKNENNKPIIKRSKQNIISPKNISQKKYIF